MNRGLNRRVLALACGLLLAGAVVAYSAPAWDELASAGNYGHVTFTRVGNTFSFTVFNDQVLANHKIAGWAFYPTATLSGVVPVINGAPPSGWTSVGWEGPVTGLGPQFGDIRDSFVTSQSLFNIMPGESQSGFTVNWITDPLPTDLKFAVWVTQPGCAFWAQAGPSPCPIPDASTLLLTATGVLGAVPSIRRSLRRRT